jgi:hypothetical protein
MGKRSDFARRERDFYPTPVAAVVPLLPHLKARTRFVEPCAGAGHLIDHLTAAGHVCARAWDLEPHRDDIEKCNALETLVGNIDCFITNPPWDRRTLHPLIVRLTEQAPAWLLFDADWIHTVQAIPYLPRLRRIVAVGRVKWIPDTKFTGKDNCFWHLFDARHNSAAQFIGRRAA